MPRPSDRPSRRTPFATVIALVASFCLVVQVGPAGTVVAAGSTRSAPASDAPAETVPPSDVDTSDVDGSDVATSTTELAEEVDDDQDDVVTDDDADALTWIAIAATLVLLGVAVWWMARRTSPGAGPRMDDDWPGDSEVI